MQVKITAYEDTLDGLNEYSLVIDDTEVTVQHDLGHGEWNYLSTATREPLGDVVGDREFDLMEAADEFIEHFETRLGEEYHRVDAAGVLERAQLATIAAHGSLDVEVGE